VHYLCFSDDFFSLAFLRMGDTIAILGNPRSETRTIGIAIVSVFIITFAAHQLFFTAMAGDRYFISDQHIPYYVTCTVIKWIDLFTRRDYRDVIVDSLNHCCNEKGITIYAWVIMSNHMHLVAQASPPGEMSSFLRDFKKYTSKKFIETMDLINESRSEWLKDKFSFEAKRTRRAEKYKIWKDGSHPIDLTNIDMMEKINYIHNNPVRAGLVESPEHYLYSSARDYAGRKGLVKVTVI
jgi:putative transposase